MCVGGGGCNGGGKKERKNNCDSENTRRGDRDLVPLTDWAAILLLWLTSLKKLSHNGRPEISRAQGRVVISNSSGLMWSGGTITLRRPGEAGIRGTR